MGFDMVNHCMKENYKFRWNNEFYMAFKSCPRVYWISKKNNKSGVWESIIPFAVDFPAALSPKKFKDHAIKFITYYRENYENI